MSSEYTVSIKLHNKKFDKVMDVNKIYKYDLTKEKLNDDDNNNYDNNSIIVYSTNLSSSEEPLNKLSIYSFVKDEDTFIFNLPDNIND